MTYHVLARKWRPQTFSDLVGQAHVVKALTFALSQNQVHHAYLLTGTRGVGKTSIARIFAKSLNCEKNGVSPDPCGECQSCQEIKAGKFVDLIEVDAASRTGVDETRELIESVAYLPTKGRYKVYLIDEVHMFSKSSFNALLKTLEEPPEHVKFILATTDPEKLPITILSRCLQFNLKSLTQQQILQHLVNICRSESIDYEEDALALLAGAGEGSMRDTLSMMDQAIAYGRGQLNMAEVSEILGTIQPADIEAIVFAIATNNPTQLSEALHRLDDYEVDARAFLIEVMRRLQRMAWAKEGIVSELSPLLQSTVADTPRALLHLWYDIAAKALPNLALAGEPRQAVEMTLLRMLAFIPNDWITRHRTPLQTADQQKKKKTTSDSSKTNRQPSQSTAVKSAQAKPVKVKSADPAIKVTKNKQKNNRSFAHRLHAAPVVEKASLDEAEASFGDGGSDKQSPPTKQQKLQQKPQQKAAKQTAKQNKSAGASAENARHLSRDDSQEPVPSMDDVRALMKKASDIKANTPNHNDHTTGDLPPWEARDGIEKVNGKAPPLSPNTPPLDDNTSGEARHIESVEATDDTPVAEKMTKETTVGKDDTHASTTAPIVNRILPISQNQSTTSRNNFDWFTVIDKLSLTDFTYHFVSLGLLRLEEKKNAIKAVLDLPQKHEVLVTKDSIAEFENALQNYFASPITVSVNLTDIHQQTPADKMRLRQKKHRATLVTSFNAHPTTKKLVDELNAQVIEKTIKENKK
ncbi:MAG: hypothetical protein CSA45_04610 [Gammaproteobacteria bacterium]|nr:MAG: hypothetical protein CSA45_04610 [Gammaproteobacteria bacterium]